MESLRFGREQFIPYLEQHTELTKEDETLLAELPPDCLLIELASASGFDMDAVETLRLSYLKAGGLPGRVAPETAARAIKKTLCRLIKEEA